MFRFFFFIGGIFLCSCVGIPTSDRQISRLEAQLESIRQDVAALKTESEKNQEFKKKLVKKLKAMGKK